MHLRFSAPTLLLALALGAQACRKPTPEPSLDPTPRCSATLSREQQRAFDDGLATISSENSARTERREPGPGVFVEQETLKLWDDQFPAAVVSRCAVADVFQARTKSDVLDGMVVLRGIIEDFRTRPQPGVLHAKRGWYSRPFEGYTNDQISMAIGDLFGFALRYAGYGWVIASVREKTVTEGTTVFATRNSLVVFVGSVLEHYRSAGGSSRVPEAALIKPILQELVFGRKAGFMWVRPPTDVDRTEVEASIEAAPTRMREY